MRADREALFIEAAKLLDPSAFTNPLRVIGQHAALGQITRSVAALEQLGVRLVPEFMTHEMIAAASRAVPVPHEWFARGFYCASNAASPYAPSSNDESRHEFDPLAGIARRAMHLNQHCLVSEGCEYGVVGRCQRENRTDEQEKGR
jgi:hypothetical protein